MRYVFDGRRNIVVLQKGEELIAALRQFVAEVGMRAGTVSGIGGALEAELGFYDLASQAYRWKTFDQLQEITTLQGTVAVDEERGETVLHLHGVLSGPDYQTVGGHVKRLIVGGTCELTVEPFGEALVRRRDDETGLNLLNV